MTEKEKASYRKKLHNKGQSDASEGYRPKPPHGAFDMIVMSPVEGDNGRRYNDNKAYWTGYEHQHKQRGKKNKDSGDGCFITTATLSSIGKPDSCEELNLFRDFRDNWLQNQFGGVQLIEQYYLVAPIIVNAINAREDREKIYNDLWIAKIKPCYELIRQGQFTTANEIYCSTVIELNAEFLS